MSSIGTRVDLQSKNDVRIIDFRQSSVDPNVTTQNNPFPNTIVISFPFPQNFSRCEAALASLYLFYSWYNISAAFGNNIFSYAYPTASGYGPGTFTVTIPDGFYSIDELSDFFQQVQIANGTYVTLTSDTTNTPITFLSWTANSVYYRTTIISNTVPASSNATYTTANNTVPYPGGGRPAVATDPSLIILPTNAAAGSNTPGQYSFSKTLGISPGTYPAQGTTTPYTANGQFPPVIESTNVVNVSTSFINNGSLSQNPTIITTFSPQVGFGEQIVETPFFPTYLPVSDNIYPQIVIQFQDENFLPLNIQDPHINGRIIIRGR